MRRRGGGANRGGGRGHGGGGHQEGQKRAVRHARLAAEREAAAAGETSVACANIFKVYIVQLQADTFKR